MWKNLYLPGQIGSEKGEILLDEEYNGVCRITLEKCSKYYAITCGVYGAMVHTAFAADSQYQEIYDAMKNELQGFIDKDTTYDEELAFYEEFTSKY